MNDHLSVIRMFQDGLYQKWSGEVDGLQGLTLTQKQALKSPIAELRRGDLNGGWGTGVEGTKRRGGEESLFHFRDQCEED